VTQSQYFNLLGTETPNQRTWTMQFCLMSLENTITRALFILEGHWHINGHLTLLVWTWKVKLQHYIQHWIYRKGIQL